MRFIMILCAAFMFTGCIDEEFPELVNLDGNIFSQTGDPLFTLTGVEIQRNVGNLRTAIIDFELNLDGFPEVQTDRLTRIRVVGRGDILLTRRRVVISQIPVGEEYCQEMALLADTGEVSRRTPLCFLVED